MSVTLVDSPFANVANIARALRAAASPDVILSRRSAAKDPLIRCDPRDSGGGSFAVYAAQDDRPAPEQGVHSVILSRRSAAKDPPIRSDSGDPRRGSFAVYAAQDDTSAPELTRDPAAIARASKIVLPGVGSFAAAMAWLRDTRIDVALREAVANGAFLLGICVGHQLLFDSSDEMGMTRGLGLVRGDVRRFKGALPVPQIGWNRVRARDPVFDGVEQEAFYFVNSYAVRNADAEVATADYDGPFTAAVHRGRVFGVQFHPEKSSAAGLRVLRNFVACN